eukprot:TRINITY_DN18249_c0_g1_i1.p1 TRINITY_DN18249_c0_g1~~TRINITY_DN18249_c0_g1_i1.p1  ORF type:complete len:158 (+),score=22.26 TRINITY_DN18249_c0_g1_i1:45-518(+)
MLLLRRSGLLTMHVVKRAKVAPSCCRRWASGSPAAKVVNGVKTVEKMSGMLLAKKYGSIAAMVILVEYCIAFVVLYVLCALTPAAEMAVSYVGKDTVAGYKESISSWPYVGPFIRSCEPETATNIILAVVINEVSWYIRAPIIFLVVPRLAVALGRA